MPFHVEEAWNPFSGPLLLSMTLCRSEGTEKPLAECQGLGICDSAGHGMSPKPDVLTTTASTVGEVGESATWTCGKTNAETRETVAREKAPNLNIGKNLSLGRMGFRRLDSSIVPNFRTLRKSSPQKVFEA